MHIHSYKILGGSVLSYLRTVSMTADSWLRNSLPMDQPLSPQQKGVLGTGC